MVVMSSLLALTAAVATLGLQLDAEDTWTARTERAVGATMSTSVNTGPLTFDFASTVGRNLPLAGALHTPVKLGASAACVLNSDFWQANVAAVVENGAPRLDFGVGLTPGDVELALQVESVADDAQLRILVAWPIDF